MTRRRKIARWFGVIVTVLAVAWFVVNPAGQFGFCDYAFTVYNRKPILIEDVEIRSDGARRSVAKTHNLTMERLEWLLEAQGEVLIISTGWDGFVSVDPQARKIASCEVHILKNAEAIALYNRCRREGKTVSIHYHSTC